MGGPDRERELRIDKNGWIRVSLGGLLTLFLSGFFSRPAIKFILDFVCIDTNSVRRKAKNVHYQQGSGRCQPRRY
jgi:hypothetical protein